MKRLAIVAAALLALAAPPALAAAPPSWNLTGVYTVDFTCTSGCDSTYVHTMTIATSDDGTGAVTGAGSYIADPTYTWTVTGTVSGSNVSLDIEWVTPVEMQTFNPLLLTGTIDSSGGMSGTASDAQARTFTWATTSGEARPLATRLVFTEYPADPSPTELGTITVALEDAGGTVVTSDTRTVTLSTNQNSSSFHCSNGPSLAAVSGVATFTGCTQETAAQGYTITASVYGLPDFPGDAFDVTSPTPTTGTITFVKVIDNWASEQGAPPLAQFTMTYADAEAGTDGAGGTAHSGDVVTLPFGDFLVAEDLATLPNDYAVPSDNVQCLDNVSSANAGEQDVAYLSLAAPDWTCTVHNVYSVPIFRKVIVGGSARLGDFTFTVTQGSAVTTIPGSQLVPSPDGTTGTYYGGALVGSFTIAETAAPARYQASYDMGGLVKSTNCAWVAGETYEAPPVCTITNTYVVPPPAPVVPVIALSVSANPASLTGSGAVTYTYSVTNPGTVPLGGVAVSDATCSPAAYVSGDTSADGILQAGETWAFSCTTTLAATTTSVASASGTGRGLTASASASTTVTVGAAPARTAVVLTDGIAAGVNRGASGFGTSSVVVEPNHYVTVIARTDPILAGSLVEIWVQSRTTGWHSLTLRRVAADGTVHYFARVNGWTGYWVKFAGDTTHAPAGSHGRIATNPS